MDADPARIAELVESARRLPVAERRAFLDGFRLDEATRRAVERALDADRTVAWKPGAPAGHFPTRAPGQPASATAALDPMVGREFAGIAVERVIGSGGMGRVYLGIDRASGARVALKVLLRTQRDESVRRRFDREGRLLEKLRHPGIAAVLRTGIEQDADVDVPYIVMEYVEGVQGIADHVFRERLGAREAVQEFLQACDAVGHAHREGYVHRDIKPANILVDRHGRVKVIDFGVARAISVDPAAATVRTETGQIVGTMQYMSPEQFVADPRGIDARTDVYALCAVLYELLTGVQPHDLRGMPVHEAARTVCETDVADIRRCHARIDDRLADIVMDGLSRSPSRRPADADALALRLRGWLSAASGGPSHAGGALPDVPPVRAGRTSAAAPAARPAAVADRRRGGWWAIVVIAVAALAALLIAFGILDIRALVGRLRGGASGPPPASTAHGAALPGPAQRVHELRVASAPGGARVTVDGEPRGVTPCVVLLPDRAGTRQVAVALDGWREHRVAWNPGDPAVLAVNLAPPDGATAVPRVFMLDVAALPKGTVLVLRTKAATDPPGRSALPAGITCVELGFRRDGRGWTCDDPIVLEARHADGSPAAIEVGAARGTGTLRLELSVDDVRDPLRVRVR